MRWLMYNNETISCQHMPPMMDPCRKWDLISRFLQHFLSGVWKYRQIELSDGNWSFARIRFTGSPQMGVLTAACQINQVCNGSDCKHDKRGYKRHRVPSGLMRRPATGWFSESDAACWKLGAFSKQAVLLWAQMFPWTICFQVWI